MILETKDFVDQLFDALNSKEYLKYAPDSSVKSMPVLESKSDSVLSVKSDRRKDSTDAKKPRVRYRCHLSAELVLVYVHPFLCILFKVFTLDKIFYDILNLDIHEKHLMWNIFGVLVLNSIIVSSHKSFLV